MGKIDDLKAKIIYESDTKRFHRFKIFSPDGSITGTVYFSKSFKKLPKIVVLENERSSQDEDMR
ncbi:hypothetical protein JCM13304A_04780 [Desulfothermus okinawensis JCM 13304]